MADLAQAARSPLSHFPGAAATPSSAAPVSLREISFRGLVNLRLDPENGVVRGAAEAVLGLTLPREPNRCSDGSERSALWLGPDEFLIVTEPGAEATLVTALRQGLSGQRAAITDVSDGRTIIEISGSDACDVLAKGCGLDLHPRVFAPGHCAQSGLAKARIILRQIDASPRFEIFVERSHAEYLWLWLNDAAREYQLVQLAVT
jgi:sarcosine oxidase subunit gamma